MSVVRRSLRVVTLHVLTPVAIGTGIYVCFRVRTLRVFHWLDSLGLSRAVDSVRDVTVRYGHTPGRMLLFSAPDALWVYALTASMMLLWSGQPNRARHIWILAGVAMGIGGEIGQLVRIVPGTFDWLDVLLCLLAFCCAFRFHSPPPTSSTR